MAGNISLSELAKKQQATKAAVEAQTGKYSDKVNKLSTEQRCMTAPGVPQKKHFSLKG